MDLSDFPADSIGDSANEQGAGQLDRREKSGESAAGGLLERVFRSEHPQLPAVAARRTEFFGR